jgi:hypothetical protein
MSMSTTNRHRYKIKDMNIFYDSRVDTLNCLVRMYQHAASISSSLASNYLAREPYMGINTVLKKYGIHTGDTPPERYLGCAPAYNVLDLSGVMFGNPFFFNGDNRPFLSVLACHRRKRRIGKNQEMFTAQVPTSMSLLPVGITMGTFDNHVVDLTSYKDGSSKGFRFVDYYTNSKSQNKDGRYSSNVITTTMSLSTMREMFLSVYSPSSRHSHTGFLKSVPVRYKNVVYRKSSQSVNAGVCLGFDGLSVLKEEVPVKGRLAKVRALISAADMAKIGNKRSYAAKTGLVKRRMYSRNFSCGYGQLYVKHRPARDLARATKSVFGSTVKGRRSVNLSSALRNGFELMTPGIIRERFNHSKIEDIIISKEIRQVIISYADIVDYEKSEGWSATDKFFEMISKETKDVTILIPNAWIEDKRPLKIFARVFKDYGKMCMHICSRYEYHMINPGIINQDFTPISFRRVFKGMIPSGGKLSRHASIFSKPRSNSNG